ncbi:MAG: radical SAM protein [Myxococcaceae bacterium]|nr:radical SAM protein [Myxococcaceae bacterium]
MNLKNHDFDELFAKLAPLGASRTAALKLFASVFAHRARSMADVRTARQVPAGVRDWVQANATLPSLDIVERRRADDGFVKYLFTSPLGGRFEAVRIPLFDTHYVVCISSQVGCALACDFCMTGKMGFSRNLETWEIVDQVLQLVREADRPVRGVVFMGMGEPLLNYANASRAARVMCHPAGLAISGRSITFSTAGWVPGIKKYIADDPPWRLAFSLTSAIAEKRATVLPVEHTHPLPTLVEQIRRYSQARNDERVMLAYVCIAGFNTGLEDALALKHTFEGIPIKVDLIDVTDPTGRYLPPSPEELKRFRDHLQVLQSPIARRYSGGKDIGAACGTLEASQRGGVLLHGPGPLAQAR